MKGKKTWKKHIARPLIHRYRYSPYWTVGWSRPVIQLSRLVFSARYPVRRQKPPKPPRVQFKMPWRDKLKQLKHEWDNLTSQPLQNASQQPANQPEPYWKPVFEPTTLVNDEWELKVGNGNDGWGNQEMQHYSADAANSFQ